MIAGVEETLDSKGLSAKLQIHLKELRRQSTELLDEATRQGTDGCYWLHSVYDDLEKRRSKLPASQQGNWIGGGFLKPMLGAADSLVGWVDEKPDAKTEKGEISERFPIVNGFAKETTKPKEYLTSWRAILIALGLKSNDEDREKVRNLNTRYAGPIIFSGQGAQPKVEKSKLIEWWNGLAIQWETGYARGRDAKPTIDDQYDYGREGTVAPEISGGVKKRRKDRKG